MACCNLALYPYNLPSRYSNGYIPFYIRNQLVRVGSRYYIKCPCGVCINCKVDRRNWLEDAINYELKKNYKTASFVCLTYDNYHIQHLLLKQEDISGNTILFQSNENSVQYTLRKKDYIDAIKRLRSYIAYNNCEKKYGKDICDRKFKVIYCTEYGGQYNRPHAHFIFMGLSPEVLEILLPKVWKNGIIDIGTLRPGGIRYVLDYCEKQVRGKKARYNTYEKYGLEAPSLIYSKGLGKGLILDNLAFIKSHNLEYPCGASGKTRPIPSYYRQKIFQVKNTFKKQLDNVNYQRSQRKMEKIKSLNEFNQFRHDLAMQRAKTLINRSRIKGSPQEDYYLFDNSNIV